MTPKATTPNNPTMRVTPNYYVALLVLCIATTASAQLPNAWQIDDHSGSTGLYYSTNLPSDLQQAATNAPGGWSFTVNARFVTDYGAGNQTMVMIYGDGVTRWEILWSLNNGDLQSLLYNNGGTYLVTSGGTGTNLYHTHQIIYNPTNHTATYLVDGQVRSTNWTGSAASGWPAGKVAWGAISPPNVGSMNFHSARFEVTNSVVAAYDAGTQNNPISATDPVASGWVLSTSPPPSGTSINAISPDTALLPIATTLAASGFTTSGAVLNGRVNPNASPTTSWFEWGADPSYGSYTPPQDAGSAATDVAASNLVSGLVAGLDYHFRLVASNAFGTAAGADQTFQVPSFVPVAITNLPSVPNAKAAWGDYDNDGHLDFLSPWNSVAGGLWHNNGDGTFSNVTATAVPGLPESSIAAWGDYDNDGRLDFLLTAFSGAPKPVAQLWHNNGDGTFSNVTATAVSGLRGVQFGSAAWGDCDNDGRLDFLVAGSFPGGALAELWHNNGNGTFNNITPWAAPGLPGVGNASVTWADYDNDGWLDFLITGSEQGSGTPISQIWHNNGNGTFSNVTDSVALNLPQVELGSVAWGDYDNDGRLDFIISGYTGSDIISEIWHQNGDGTFSDATAGAAPDLPGVAANSGSAITWGDYDNDGWLDFLLTGSGTGDVSEIWRNNEDGTFSNVTAKAAPRFGILDPLNNFPAWGDYDGDGRLDFLVMRDTNSSNAELWHNNVPTANQPPSAPTGLQATINGSVVTLSWNASTDDHTPSPALTYNVRIGLTPGGTEVVSPPARTDGRLLLPQAGRGIGLSAVYPLPTGWTFYWSVQAVDGAFVGSPFAPEQQFTVNTSASALGDANGDGVVDQNELDTVLHNYWQTSPPNMESVVSPSNTLFRFDLSNLSSLDFHVLASTNLAAPLMDWTDIGQATLQYQFSDPDATNYPQRYYQLVWP